MKNRSGQLIQNLSGEAAYMSFRPAPLPPVPPIELDLETSGYLLEAHKNLALLDGLSARIPNIDLFVSMYVRKEALLSSQIEGTQCTLDDILDPNVLENANLEVADVINYIRAADYAVDRLQTLPLCGRLFRETHEILMQGVRGQDKNPGEYRISQNWIGGQGSTLKNARYIPPNPEDMIEAMSDLEKYLNSDDTLDPLIQAALIHYQFETIHPFLDGNGRVGRLILLLFLMEKHLLSRPVLYISYYLKSNRIEYYDRMTEIRKSGNYEQWITFFLRALKETASDAIETIDKLTALHARTLKTLQQETPARQMSNMLVLFDYLERNPIIDTKKTADTLKISYNTIAKYIDFLCEKRILRQTSKAGKSRIYSYTEYLDILRKDT